MSVSGDNEIRLSEQADRNTGNDAIPQQESDDSNTPPVCSEVAMRIHLLGKLIIPPASH